MKITRSHITRILTIILWFALASGIVVVLVSAVQKERIKKCTAVSIDFIDQHNYRMLDEQEILNSLWPSYSLHTPVGKSITSIDLYHLEQQLSRNPWILSANFFLDQNQVLHIDVEQREPVARLFTPDGNSVYMDKDFNMLPIKSTDMISLPVFTNFYTGTPNASDSALFKRIVSLSTYMITQPFWMAQIEQVNIDANGNFELTTQIGDHAIRLGKRSDWEAMLTKLKSIYRLMNEENGWTKYSFIDLQFKDQVVCVKKNSLYEIKDSVSPILAQDSVQQTVNRQSPPEKNKL
jgi:cell division protein FtsQ